MDYSKVADSIAETIAKSTEPLAPIQRQVLAGAVAVWIEKAIKNERTRCIKQFKEILDR